MSLHDSPRTLENLKELQRMPKTECFRRWSRRDAEMLENVFQAVRTRLDDIGGDNNDFGKCKFYLKC